MFDIKTLIVQSKIEENNNLNILGQFFGDSVTASKFGQ